MFATSIMEDSLSIPGTSSSFLLDVVDSCEEESPSVGKVRKKKKTSLYPEDNVLKELLDDCEFYLCVKKTLTKDSKHGGIRLGCINLKTADTFLDIDNVEKFWLYVSNIPNRSFVYIDEEQVKYCLVEGELDVKLYSGLSNRCFGLQFIGYDTNYITVDIILYENCCQEPALLSDTKQRNVVLSHFFNMNLTVLSIENTTSLCDTQALYSAVKDCHQKDILSGEVQHPSLVPILRPYQQNAVRWMLGKETQIFMNDIIDELFVKIRSENHQELYYNHFNGCVTREKPEHYPFPTGGILADEMGLGKTVEVLALILLHKREKVISKTALDNCKNNLLSSGGDDPSRNENEDEKLQLIDTVASESDKVSGESALVEESESTLVEESESVYVKERKCKVKRSIKKELSSTETVRRVKKQFYNYCENEESELGKKRSSKGTNYEILRKWYNDMLSETVKRTPRMSWNLQSDLKCVCGGGRKISSQIQCNTCKQYQHTKCVGNPSKKDYHCPQCWCKLDHVMSGATLIVSPASISNQWLMETEKHIKDFNFKVLMYRGVQKGFLQPHVIAGYDLVLTTYETLRKELMHADIDSSDNSRLRHSKRFFAAPSPLTFIQWWRVCLDEAQMVEHTASKTATMARRFESVHRWAITGTPIQKSIHDLFGLVQFLGVTPYDDLHYWNHLLFFPYCQGNAIPLYNLLAKIMWCTRKQDVVHEINIPEQFHKVHRLNFCPIEEHFYRLLHPLCSQDFVSLCSKYCVLNVPLKSLNRLTLNKLLKPLLRLRQACSHHQIVKGFHLNQKAVTMEELLETMIKKTKLEAEESLRRTICALNGMAGIYIIKEMWIEAVECYRGVLHLCEQYKDKLKSDTLQRIHTLHNLADVLSSHPEGVSATLRDHLLQKQAEELEENYMNKQDVQVSAAREALSNHTESISELEASFFVGKDAWWAELVLWLMEHDDKGEFLCKVRLDLSENQIQGQISVINRVRSLPSLKRQLIIWSEDLFQNRKKCLQKVRDLEKMPLLDLANGAVDCHLRMHTPAVKKKCHLCNCEGMLKMYESLLFAVSNKETEHTYIGEVLIMGHLSHGSWQPSEQEKILRVLLAFARGRHANSELLEDGAQYMKILEIMKKEFKQLRFTWTQIRDRVSVQDELHMAKLRLRLRYEDEPVTDTRRRNNPLHHLSSNISNKLETIHVIETHEVEAHAANLKSEEVLSEAEMKRKFGQLQYLENLRKNQGCKLNRDPCPVCQNELGDKWNVLHCGHCLCIECIRCLMTSNGLRLVSAKCPVCRDVTPFKEVFFVDISNKPSNEEEGSDIIITGSHSTKVEAIIRCLISIRNEDPNVKALIFSMWDRVLEVLEIALQQNNISIVRLQPGSKYQENLQYFKKTLGVTALLMPLRSGAKGLNLTEATHVLFVEPVLNPADELQAIGRVHRIGQTKNTTVHHFVIHNTIEERIYEATHTNAEKWTDDSITVDQLMALFDSYSDMYICSDM